MTDRQNRWRGRADWGEEDWPGRAGEGELPRQNAPFYQPSMPPAGAEDWPPAGSGGYYKAEAAAEGLRPQSRREEQRQEQLEKQQEQAEAAAAAEDPAEAAAVSPGGRRRARIGRNLRAALRRSSPQRGHERQAECLPAAAAIVRQADMQGFALIAVIAIMSFLAAWMLFAVHFIGAQAAGWSGAIAREAVVQIMPMPGRDIEAAQAQAAEIAESYDGVARVRIVSAAETQNLLAPWLGAHADIAALPVPRLVLLELAPGGNLDYADLSAALARGVPGARLDNHQAWAGRLARGAHIMQALALALLALVLAAMMLTVIFATRGACVSNAHIIEVLHFIGADDNFIARRFDVHFFRTGLKGAACGGLAAAGLFALLFLWVSAYRATPEGSQMVALFGRLEWDGLIFAEIAALALGIAVLTMATAHWTIMRRLYHMDEKSSGFLAPRG